MHRIFDLRALIALIALVGLTGTVPQSGWAQLTTSTAEGEGAGFSRGEAIAMAIADAAGRAFGLTISADISTLSKAEERGETFEYLNQINRDIKSQIRTSQNRPIVSYDVIWTDQTGGGSWNAGVRITYSHYIQPGSDTSRRSVVVVSSGGKKPSLAREKFEQSLIASRRFDVLTRDNHSLFLAEKEFIRSEDAATQEMARLGISAGADYLAVVEIKRLDIQTSSERIRLTGEMLSSTIINGRLSLRMIEFSSRKIKWHKERAFQERLNGAKKPSEERVAGLVSQAADYLVENMIAAIYPIRVIKTIGKIAILNRGEGAVSIGETYRVFAEGERLIDPQSGEDLGSHEFDVGIGIITDVKPKFAYLEMQGVNLDPNLNYIVRALYSEEIAPRRSDIRKERERTRQSKTSKTSERSRDSLLTK